MSGAMEKVLLRVMAFQRPNESGILRRKEESEEELLVFGYSCKLFRDDEKALYVDQGKHLIPWMGDESLRIDRYDVRGALYDLSQYEAISGQQEELLWGNMSSEERRLEQLCDEERYRALTHNEDEERLYQEEELKRLHQALGGDKKYGQVSYSYDEENGGAAKQATSSSEQPEEVDEPFVPPVELDLPVDMVVPETVKLNAIIEKTIVFIQQQGSQMEIILKMKQADNPQFEFLSYNSPLHAYYRHVMNAVKSGRYRPKLQSAVNNSEANRRLAEVENAVPDSNHYLHHSLWQVPPLMTSINPVSAPSIPSINYKPSSDCAYSMLVNKIKNNQNKLLGKLSDDILTSDNFDMSEGGGDFSSPKSQEAVESMEYTEETGERRPRAARRKRRKRQQGGCAYNDASVDQDCSIDGIEYNDGDAVEDEVASKRVEPNVDPLSIKGHEVPPVDLQQIIDKMASYVAKNGRSFEEIVKSKNDSRFSFLDSSNIYHVYYRTKVESFEQKRVDTKVENVTDTLNKVNRSGTVTNVTVRDSVENGNSTSTRKVSSNSTKSSGKGNQCKPQPVCFSIKRPKETESLEIKSALPVEESSDDGNEQNGEGDVLNDGGVNSEVVQVNHEGSNKDCSLVRVSESIGKIESKGKEHVKNAPESVGKSKENVEVKKQKREKVKLISEREREKQLQSERKKRAAVFLNSLRKTSKASVDGSTELGEEDEETPVLIGPQLPDDMKLVKSDSISISGGDDNEGDDDDVDSDSGSSPPSSVTSPDVTFVSEIIATDYTPKSKGSNLVNALSTLKSRSERSTEKRLPHRDRGLEYRHRHRKRKRSRSPSRKHHTVHPSIRLHYHHNRCKEALHMRRRKHHRAHRKDHEKFSGGRDYSGVVGDTTTSSATVSRRHKHARLKKRSKRKEEKKHSANKSSSSIDSESV